MGVHSLTNETAVFAVLAAARLALLGLVVAACTTAPMPPFPQDQGTLQRASDKVSAPRRAKRDGTHASSSPDDDDDDGWGDLCAEIAWDLLGWPWWGPYEVMEGSDQLRAGYYLRHPYARPGAPLVDPLRVMPSLEAIRSPVHLRATAECGTDFDAIDRFGLSLRVETAVRVGLDAAWSRYREELAGGGSDTLDLGDVNLVFRFAQGESGEMRTGLGANWFHKTPVDEAGFNFTYGGDFYLGNPWIASAEIDWGTLGAATRFHGRATFGADWRGVEALVGFDYESLDSVGLPAWIVGGRVWF